MDYRAAVDYLYNLGHETLSMKLGLENITRVAESLNRPDKSYKTVHVAGTNGKGSFCAMLASILAQSSIPTGLFTSPHLIDIEERFKYNLEPIGKEDFGRLMGKIKSNIDRLMSEGVLEARPTFFEHVTALAMEYFRERSAVISILEVGLGGRFDSTNIIDPLLSVITPIDFDHQQYLGNSLAEIASEKAGILKPKATALIASQKEEAKRAIEQTAKSLGTELIYLTPDRIRSKYSEDGFWRFDFFGELNSYENVRVGLRGRHQVETAGLAILAAEHLAMRGFAIDGSFIMEGIESAYWPGRLEKINGEPVILLDGAHNTAGAHTLKLFLDEWLVESGFINKSRVLIFSAMRDKNIMELAALLFPLFDEVILVQRDDPRSFDAVEWSERLSPLVKKISAAKGASDALDKARNEVSSDGLIVASGSLHLIGEMKQMV